MRRERKEGGRSKEGGASFQFSKTLLNQLRLYRLDCTSREQRTITFFFKRDRKGGRKRGRETSFYCLLYTLLGMEPATQACALTRNRTGDLSVCGTMPN